MTLLAASVSLVVAAFLSYNAMSIAIAQRRPSISTMRALGGKRRTIMGDMLAEAALVGFLGGAVGSVAGIVIGHFAIGRLPSTMVQSLDARIEWVLAPYVVPAADRGVRHRERRGLGAGGTADPRRRTDRGAGARAAARPRRPARGASGSPQASPACFCSP